MRNYPTMLACDSKHLEHFINSSLYPEILKSLILAILEISKNMNWKPLLVIND